MRWLVVLLLLSCEAGLLWGGLPEESWVHARLGAKDFKLEVANTPATRRLGLMFRRALPEQHGMLFVFDEELYCSFWMKNTYVPLDMIWLDEAKKVVYIKERAEPLSEQSIVPNVKARYVVELSAGTVQSLRMKIGDVVMWDRI